MTALDDVDAATVRDKPKHIRADCEGCGSLLVLSDLLDDPEMNMDDVWWDEWECPRCRDGVHMDWPRDAVEELVGLARKAGGE